MTSQAYQRHLVAVLEFKYLGRVLTASYDNCTAVVGNLRKSRKRWERMLRVLGWEGVKPRTSGNIYKSIDSTVFHRVLVDFSSDQKEPRQFPPQGGPTSGKISQRVLGQVGVSIRR